MQSAWHVRTHPPHILCSTGADPSLPDAKNQLSVCLSLSHVTGLPCTHPCLGHVTCKFTWQVQIHARCTLQHSDVRVHPWDMVMVQCVPIHRERAQCAAPTTPCWLQDARHTPATWSHSACSAHASSHALHTKGSAHTSQHASLCGYMLRVQLKLNQGATCCMHSSGQSPAKSSAHASHMLCARYMPSAC